MLIDVKALERRIARFDASYPALTISLSGSDWKQAGDLYAAGEAEMLDRKGSRAIKVSGRLRCSMRGDCGRCLEAVAANLDGNFELLYYPMEQIAKKEDAPVDAETTAVGFYEADGLELTDVLKEQILLWLPVRALCRDDCRGICPHCGVNRNREHCSCQETFVDSRWDSLRELRPKK